MGTSLLDQLHCLSICFGWVLKVDLDGAIENHESKGDILIVRITKWVKSAHETKERMEFSLCDLPMLFEQVEGQDSRDFLLSCTDGQVSLVIVIETTMRILVEFQIVDRRLKEAIEAHVRWVDILDDQSCRICNACL